ncbi:ATP-grasp domain-containing protein [Burkholderiales bacterium]|nr:ATP-grasp domain-containing protein [Burkholderiales bacterium]
MKLSSILVANRAEIAIRVARACGDLGLRTAMIYSQDDTESLHRRIGDASHALTGYGPSAYLDGDAVIEAARLNDCDAIHPGYGFLSERADFARQCEAAGLTFIGPSAEHLALFGDKTRARAAALKAKVPVTPGIDHSVSLEEAKAFFRSLEANGQAMIIKAKAGGGGRGTRVVQRLAELEAAYARCRSEANLAFGVDEVYVESFLKRARHIEVQVLGDRNGDITHLGERECSVQRRFQKLVEIAPAPALTESLRRQIFDAAMRLAKSAQYTNLGTFEFLVDTSTQPRQPFVFIEANARLQVEHTVTEAVTGVDLVQAQIRLAGGDTLYDLGLNKAQAITPHGYAIQARVSMESISAGGEVVPTAGTLLAYEMPSGPGIRTDGFGYAGYKTSSSFDALLVKVIGHAADSHPAAAATRILRALSELRIEGVSTNIDLLRNIIKHPDFLTGGAHTRWFDEQIAVLSKRGVQDKGRLFPRVEKTIRKLEPGQMGVRVDGNDPLALFNYDTQRKTKNRVTPDLNLSIGVDEAIGVVSPIQGTIVAIEVDEGDTVIGGQSVIVIEAMKMEHVITADFNGIVRAVNMSVGDVVQDGYPLLLIERMEGSKSKMVAPTAADPDLIRSDLQENIDRHAFTLDKNRPEAVAKRRSFGYRMIRESVAQLVDPGTFKEYWPLTVARQHTRFDIETLRKNTPADGLVAGIGAVNGHLFKADNSVMVIAYDYTVLAGTQGARNHAKQDRMFSLAKRLKLPVIVFGEGGGGRPGEDPGGIEMGIDTNTFTQYAQLSGLVPLVAIVNGRCFAGNTALVASSDVIIATEGATLGMGGPAMIEGGGLGVYTPEEVGPMSFQVPNGVVDILVKDEFAAVETAKKYLSYFQGPIDGWEASNQKLLRHAVPENRLRLYDMREIITTIADADSFLEIREKFGVGLITAFIRVEGQPLGVIANNPHHLAGAIDSAGADKGARFVQLCDAFDIPILSLMDCPGIMVGPEFERTALVRHALRLFNVGANITTPMFGVVVRKAYGLGVQAMCGASSEVPYFTVAWPTAEFAAMNIEGSVKLAFRKELMAISDPGERKAYFDQRVEKAYRDAKAVNAATGGGIDEVIDPADTRTWIMSGLNALPPLKKREGKKHPYIDPW